MTRINRAYVKKLEDLILQLDSTFSDIEAATRKGYMARDMPVLHRTADAIRDRRRGTMSSGRTKKST